MLSIAEFSVLARSDSPYGASRIVATSNLEVQTWKQSGGKLTAQTLELLNFFDFEKLESPIGEFSILKSFNLNFICLESKL